MHVRLDVRRWAAALMVAAVVPCTFAQSLSPTGTLGLKPLPDTTRVLTLPFDDHWSLASWVKPAAWAPGQGLKVDVGGSYGWGFAGGHRLSVGAAVGPADDGTARVFVNNPSTAWGGFGLGRLPSTSGALGARDLALNVAWRWSPSSSLDLTSGLGLRYSLTDPFIGWQSAVRPASTTGYVGLQLKF